MRRGRLKNRPLLIWGAASRSMRVLVCFRRLLVGKFEVNNSWGSMGLAKWSAKSSRQRLGAIFFSSVGGQGDGVQLVRLPSSR